MDINRFFAVIAALVAVAAPAFCGPLYAGWETDNPFVGVTYSKLRDSDVHPILGWSTSPLSVDVMEIDLGAEGISFICTPSNGAAAGDTDRQTTMNFMLETNSEIAINTNFFSTGPTDCLGLVVSNGSVVSGSSTNYHSINISLDNMAELITVPGTNIYPLGNAFSGNRVIVQNGTVVNDQTTERNPRTAAGYNAAENKLILMTVDGRSSSSLGVTLKELGTLMANFGASWALNLDGGGSTQMTSNATSPVYVNSPSETYRAVAANLGVHAVPDNTYHEFANFEHGNQATFAYRPGYSGSTVGIVDGSSYTQLVAGESAYGQGAMKVVIDDDAAAPGEWFTRIVSGSSATRSQNTVREASGYVGLLAKTTDANTFVSLAIDDPDTGDRAVRKEIVADGNWHWYQWNLDDSSQWESWTSSGNGVIDNADFTIDSVQVWGSADATIYLDDIAHRSTGTLNPLPRAVDDIFQTQEDIPLSLFPSAGVLENDLKTYAESISVVKLSDPAHGTLQLNSDGSLQYVPEANWNGTDTFTYKTNDGFHDSNTATVNLQVNAVNDAPIAVADGYTVPWNGQLLLSKEDGLLANDVDIDSDSLIARLFGSNNALHGTLTLYTDGRIVYKPNANYSGPDAFSYRVYDGSTQSAPVVCYLSVGDAEIAGDATRDGVVNELDAAVLASHWMSYSNGLWDYGDFNGDKWVNDLDAAILAANWGCIASRSASVPEPTLSVVLSGALFWAFLLRRASLGFQKT